MKTQEHTAGPWEILRSKRPPVEICSPDRATTVAHAYRILDNEDEQQANARLIAAAPQLLEALEAALKLWDKNHALDHFDWGKSFLTADDIRELNELPGQLKAAIRSAKGETL